MKNTDIQPAQIKRKVDSLLKKKKEVVGLEHKIEKIYAEIIILEYELSQCFPSGKDSNIKGN